MVNYKNNIWCIGLLSAMFMSGSCSKKEAAPTPSNKDENYLVVHDDPNDPIGHAVYELYQATGIPVFYNDTLARRQVGDSAGIPIYFYTTLMVAYSPSTGASNDPRYTLLPKERRVKSMLDLLKNELLTVLPPLPSVFLTDSLFTPAQGTPIIRDAHVGFNTVAIRSVDPDTMTADAKGKYVLSILTRVASQKLQVLKSALLETDFYSISRGLSPYLDPYFVQLAAISDGSQTLEDFGFITSVLYHNKVYTPDKTRDIQSYLEAVISNTPDAFNANYANYPAVLKKFAVIRSMLTDLKFKLPG
ncbi:hypothetical protein Q4E93_15270 [Flavitalea sp. BT771]|uniref:hypothetical protein n=1 Tax=Flavitalea sp. BT771 TaxID=3063329 RepID=UPI0026E14332|nr:hypothetical protein [Flavitalea sp. BT771]MDO6431966.1 hypothetical protein [Flavitalea sp. BT771]MDV6220875.1 hypothetical protein [Flavitalea sp. BT771]